MDLPRKEEIRKPLGACMWKEYTIEAAGSREDLGRLVRKMISIGWHPIGGVCIDIHEDSARFLQAMVRAREDSE